MRRILFTLFLLPILLTSCGGNGSKEVGCTQQYWDGTVGLCLPDSWSVIERDQLSERGIADNVIAAFKRDLAIAGQFPAVIVTQEALKSAIDSATYSSASVRAVTVLPAYKLIDSRSVTIDGADVDLHIYSAQPAPEEPAKRFYQVSAVAGDKGYSATGLTPLSPPKNVESEISAIMNSITFTEPKE